jgi:hypothetical protein
MSSTFVGHDLCLPVRTCRIAVLGCVCSAYKPGARRGRHWIGTAPTLQLFQSAASTHGCC